MKENSEVCTSAAGRTLVPLTQISKTMDALRLWCELEITSSILDMLRLIMPIKNVNDVYQYTVR